MKTQLTILLILLSGAAFGQIEKGTIRVGGSGNFSYSSNKTTSTVPGNTYTKKAQTFQGQFSISYFPIKNFSVGVTASGIDDVWNSGPTIPGDLTQTKLQYGVELRYYYQNFFVQSSYFYDLKTLNNFQVGLGYSFFATENIAFEPKLLYTYGVQSGYPSGKITNSNLEFNLGVSLFLNRKK